MANSAPLDEFASAPTAEAQSEALLELLKNKDLHRALDTSAFESGLQRPVHYTEDTSAGPARLVALSTLGRICAVAKSAQPMIAQRLARALDQPLPDLQLLDDSDGRFYVAGMWRYTRPKWMPAFGTPLSVPSPIWMPASAMILRFRLACTSACLIDCASLSVRTLSWNAGALTIVTC